MNKNLILIAGIVISLIAVIALFTSDDVDVTSVQIDAQTQQNKEIKSTSRDIAIDYEKTEIKGKVKESTFVKKTRPKLEKYMESRTVDRSGTFEIALINPNQDASKNTAAFTTLQGDIDGKAFFLKVPRNLIEEGAGVTELRIKNLKTNEVSSVPAVFIEDMKNPAIKQKISIDSQDIQNFQQESTEQIVPLRPGEQRN